GQPLSKIALAVLKAVSSGIEADIVGQIGKDLRTNASRLALLDQYMRMRLGDHARTASFGLRRLASMLHEQIAFSLSETAFDEFLQSQQVSFEDAEAMLRTQLLVRRAGRISFSHEMILNACAAHDIAVQAVSDPADFGGRLATPFLEPIAGDIISSIEDLEVVHTLLANVTRAELLTSSREGRYGDVARAAARAVISTVSVLCRE
ncbi:unnamed protein product, partial [Phaeothamnion confervicola]